MGRASAPDPTPTQHEWFTSQLAADVPFTIEWLGRNWLDERIAAHPDIRRSVLDGAQIDDHARTLDAILQPVEAVESASQHPGARAVPVEQLECSVDRRRLEQLECGHYIADDCHSDLSQ